MRKRLVTPVPQTVRSRAEKWLDVDRAAVLELTSEAKDYPVESAFVAGQSPGWRVGTPGPQTIRLVFDQPQKLKLISLVFEENEIARTQEFVLRWSPDNGISHKEREVIKRPWLDGGREGYVGDSLLWIIMPPGSDSLLANGATRTLNPCGSRLTSRGQAELRPRRSRLSRADANLWPSFAASEA